MITAPTGVGLRDISTLGTHTSGQLRRLGAVAGLSRADVETYAHVLTDLLGPVAERSLGLPPPSPTSLSDDHTPVEFSLSFRPDAAPSLRVLLEPGCGVDGLAENGRLGLEAIRTLARRWNFTTGPLDELQDLFMPAAPQGAFALWCALELSPGGVPKVKVYLNPAANGANRSVSTVREATRRLGHQRAFGALPAGSGYPFLALDLGDWAQPRVKVYVRHDNLTAGQAGRLACTRPRPGAASVEGFFRMAAGVGPETTALSRRPGLSCHSFTDTADTRPSGFTLHIPVRDYARHDADALTRTARILRHHGMDASVLPTALAALTERRPEDGVGLIAYLALAHEQDRPPRVTAYLSSEAYAVRPPVVETVRRTVAVS